MIPPYRLSMKFFGKEDTIFVILMWIGLGKNTNLKVGFSAIGLVSVYPLRISARSFLKSDFYCQISPLFKRAFIRSNIFLW